MGILFNYKYFSLPHPLVPPSPFKERGMSALADRG